MKIGYIDSMLVSSVPVSLLALAVVAFAQSAPDGSFVVSGTVTDSVTGRGLAGAVVTLQAGPPKAQLAAFQAQI